MFDVLKVKIALLYLLEINFHIVLCLEFKRWVHVVLFWEKPIIDNTIDLDSYESSHTILVSKKQENCLSLRSCLVVGDKTES